MPRNGSGTYSLPAGNPVITLTKIQSSWANTTMSDIGTALTGSMARDGQSAPTANWSFAGFRLQNTGAAINAQDYARADQVQTDVLGLVTSVANPSPNVYTGNIPFGATTFTLGQRISIAFPDTNTGPATLSINGGTAAPILRLDGSPLLSGMIPTAVGATLIWDGGGDWLLFTVTDASFIATGSPTFTTAVGQEALLLNAGMNNSAVGYHALAAVVTGNGNTAFGRGSLEANTSGGNNTGIGLSTLNHNTTGSFNVGVGADALEAVTTGSGNVAIGASTMAVLTTGQSNVGIGSGVLVDCVSGLNNTGVGHMALNDNLASGNSAFGFEAMRFNTSGTNNTGAGYSALHATTVGNDNTSLGNQALSLNTSGSRNTAVGSTAGNNATTANDNSSIGYAALAAATTGGLNSAIGSFALIALTTQTNCTGLGANTAVTGSNQVQLGDSATTTYAYGAIQNRSDERDKTDIRDCSLGLDFILSLTPRDFRWKYREAKGVEGSRYHHGFIAQEMPTFPEFGGYQDHKVKGGDDVLTLGYTEFIAPIVKAIQELEARTRKTHRKAHE